MKCVMNKSFNLILIWTVLLLNTVHSQEDGTFWWLKIPNIQNKTADLEHETDSDLNLNTVEESGAKIDNPIMSNSKISEKKLSNQEGSLNSLDKDNKPFVLPTWSQYVHQNNMLLEYSGVNIDDFQRQLNTEFQPATSPSKNVSETIIFRPTSQHNTQVTGQIQFPNDIRKDLHPTQTSRSEDIVTYPGDLKIDDQRQCRCMTILTCQRLGSLPEYTEDGRIRICKTRPFAQICCDLIKKTPVMINLLPKKTVTSVTNTNPKSFTIVKSLLTSTTDEPEQFNTRVHKADKLIKMNNNKTPFKLNITDNVSFPTTAGKPNMSVTTSRQNLDLKIPVINIQANVSNMVSPHTMNKANIPKPVAESFVPFSKNFRRNVSELDTYRSKPDIKFPDSDRHFRVTRSVLEKTNRIVTEYDVPDTEPEEDPYWNIKNSNINPRLTIRNRNRSKSESLRNRFNPHGWSQSNISEKLSEVPKPGIGTNRTPAITSLYNLWRNQHPTPSNKSASIVSVLGSAGASSYGQNFDYSDEINKKPAFTLQELLNNLRPLKSEKPLSNPRLSETIEKLAEAHLEKLLNESGIHETTSNQLDPDFVVFQNFLPWRRQLIERVKQEIQAVRFNDKKNTLVTKNPNKWTPYRRPSYDDTSDDLIKQTFGGYGQTPEYETPILDPDDTYDEVYEDYEVAPPKPEFLNQIYPKCGTLDDSNAPSQSPWLVRVSVEEERGGTGAWDRAAENHGAPRVSCGGAIVHPRAALVAAHCVVGSVDGTAVLRSSPRTDGGAPQERRARILTHANYRAGGTYDVALLLWRVPLQMGSGVKALCVPEDSAGTWGSAKCSALGWNSRRPVSATARVVSASSCGGERTNARTPRAICADNGASCEQDSELEGPLMCQADHRWYITGLFSWRRSCTQPARYTDITAHHAWITDMLEENYII